MPLCIASSKWKCILPKLVKASQEKPRPQAGHVAIENVIQNTEFFIFNKAIQGMELSKEEQSFVDLIKAEPMTIYEVSEMTGIHPFSFNVRRLEEIGLILRIGLTPTDILHADGSYIEYDEEASKLAVQIQAGILEKDPAHFCKDVRAAVIYKLCMELIKKLVYEETGKLPTCDVCQNTFDKTITHKAGLDYSVSLKLHKKIIGIGAPVGAYLPAVAERFGTHLLLPEHSEVGNAVGAITGSIMETVEVLIRPKPGVSAMDNPPCTLHSPFEKRDFDTLDEAVAYAEKWVRTSAKELALQAGADEVELLVEKDDKIGHLGKSWGEGIRLGDEGDRHGDREAEAVLRGEGMNEEVDVVICSGYSPGARVLRAGSEGGWKAREIRMVTVAPALAQLPKAVEDMESLKKRCVVVVDGCEGFCGLQTLAQFGIPEPAN